MNETSATYTQLLEAMRERYRDLAGCDPDDASDIGIRLKVLAEQVSLLYERALLLSAQVFPQTATGLYLERHAETRGIFRKAAVSPEGTLRFGREVPSVNDIHIPAGAVCATRSTPQLRFETTADAVLPAGQTRIDVPARAMEGGRNGNVAAGVVTVLIMGATGISSVTNPAPFAEGVDEESDEALRVRLLESCRNISNGANTAFYYDLAMSREGVESVNILPRRRGRGTVDVVVACPDGIRAQLLAELDESFRGEKEINVDVSVLAAAVTAKSVTLELDPASGHSYEVVKTQSEAAVKALMSGLAVGQPLYLSRLSGALLAVEGLRNFKITAPAADVVPAGTEVLRPGTVTVTRMITG